MKVSTRARYAVRASLCLAMHYGKGPVPLSKICNDQKISGKYLENIMRSLVKTGIVSGTKGKGGGFMLKRPPEKIKMYDIILSAEKSMAPVFCVGAPEKCNRAENCVGNWLWTGFDKAIKQYFNSITLNDMAKMKKKNMPPGCEGNKD